MQEETKQVKTKNNFLKNALSIVLLIVVSALVVFLFIKDDMDGLLVALKQTKWIFILYAFGLMMVAYILDGLCLMILTREYKRDYSFKEALQNTMLGSFFCSITPSASGGQFAQAYCFSKTKVPVEDSSSVLVLNFTIFQFSVLVCALFSVIFFYDEAVKLIPTVEILGINVSFTILIILGFILTIISVVGPILLSYSKVVNKFIGWLVRVLGKIKIIKKPEDTLIKVETKIAGFRKNLSNMKGKEKTLIKAFFVALARFVVYFSIPFFIGLGLGVELENLNLPLCISFGCYIWILSMFIVIPGGSGGAEAFFVLLFTNVLLSSTGTSLAAPGMLLWRFVTFHIPLIICGIITFIFNKKKNAKFFQEVPAEFKWIFLRKHH